MGFGKPQTDHLVIPLSEQGGYSIQLSADKQYQQSCDESPPLLPQAFHRKQISELVCEVATEQVVQRAEHLFREPQAKIGTARREVDHNEYMVPLFCGVQERVQLLDG